MTDKPVVTNATIAAAIGIVIPALMGVLAAFWTISEEQTVALSALAVAVIAAANALLGKDAASKVFIPASVNKVVKQATEQIQLEADVKIAQAESFGTPHQNQSNTPFRPELWQMPGDPPAPPPPV